MTTVINGQRCPSEPSIRIIIIRNVEYIIEPNSYDRRVIEKDRILKQRGWVAVKTPDPFLYPEFNLWFEKTCVGYWRYPVSHTLWFSEEIDVIKYHFDYYDLNQSSELIV